MNPPAPQSLSAVTNTIGDRLKLYSSSTIVVADEDISPSTVPPLHHSLRHSTTVRIFNQSGNNTISNAPGGNNVVRQRANSATSGSWNSENQMGPPSSKLNETMYSVFTLKKLNQFETPYFDDDEFIRCFAGPYCHLRPSEAQEEIWVTDRWDFCSGSVLGTCAPETLEGKQTCTECIIHSHINFFLTFYRETTSIPLTQGLHFNFLMVFRVRIKTRHILLVRQECTFDLLFRQPKKFHLCNSFSQSVASLYILTMTVVKEKHRRSVLRVTKS